MLRSINLYCSLLEGGGEYVYVSVSCQFESELIEEQDIGIRLSQMSINSFNSLSNFNDNSRGYISIGGRFWKLAMASPSLIKQSLWFPIKINLPHPISHY